MNEPLQPKEKMYKFKSSVSSQEAAEVMRIIKWNKRGLVFESSLKNFPELRSYFEPVEGNI